MSFALRFVRWRFRMMRNLLADQRELVALVVLGALFSVGGAAALWFFSARALRVLLEAESLEPARRPLGLTVLSLVTAYFFMALANVLTGFFSPQRMEERERLLGPLPAPSLFLTELVDAVRLPLVILLAVAGMPLLMVTLAGELPGWVLLLTLVNLVVLTILPTLGVIAGVIGAIRLIPSRWLDQQGLLFAFFVGAATLAAFALEAIRADVRGSGDWGLLSPTVLVVDALLAGCAGDVTGALRSSGLFLGLGGVVALTTWGLYRYAFLERLERFGVGTDRQADDAGRLWRWGQRWLRRRLPGTVAALVIKDLRSSRRDTLQRVGFTALAAVVLALVVSDLVLGRMVANIFLPLFTFYALFLVACQGLSTFSSEGGVLENLARFPIHAGEILRAKIWSHAVLFVGVCLAAGGLAVLAPSPVPLLARALLAGLWCAVMIPGGILLSLIAVCLGAIFPKPGEGGGRKEISVFAMGLFFQLVGMLVVTLPASVVGAAILGWEFVWLPLAAAAVWWGTLKLLHGLADRAITRALGAELRVG